MADNGNKSRAAVPVWERWTPRLSSGAAFLTTLCCLGVSAAVSLVTAVGATFLTRDSTLQPLLAVTLLITIAGSALTFRRHRNPLPLILTVAASVAIFWALYGPGQASADHGSGAQPTAEQHADEHAPSTDEHAAEGGSGHGGNPVWVWGGLVVLVGAQAWDFWRVRTLRRGEQTPTTEA